MGVGDGDCQSYGSLAVCDRVLSDRSSLLQARLVICCIVWLTALCSEGNSTVLKRHLWFWPLTHICLWLSLTLCVCSVWWHGGGRGDCGMQVNAGASTTAAVLKPDQCVCLQPHRMETCGKQLCMSMFALSLSLWWSSCGSSLPAEMWSDDVWKLQWFTSDKEEKKAEYVIMKNEVNHTCFHTLEIIQQSEEKKVPACF